jgi:metal-responsive CopG/Arc/MetJ family transcriptional regulator
MARKNKIIQVPMSEDLLAELDAISRKQDRSRASVIREAAAEYITRADEAERERRYIEGLEKYGEALTEDEQEAWNKLQMDALEPEDFSDWKD